VSCRDSLLPDAYSLSSGSKENCNSLMAVDQGLLKRLQPEPYGFQLSNGAYTAVRIRKLPPSADLEAQSEDRHLTEYKQTIMRSELCRPSSKTAFLRLACSQVATVWTPASFGQVSDVNELAVRHTQRTIPRLQSSGRPR
jgi:hypothetical protein